MSRLSTVSPLTAHDVPTEQLGQAAASGHRSHSHLTDATGAHGICGSEVLEALALSLGWHHPCWVAQVLHVGLLVAKDSLVGCGRRQIQVPLALKGCLFLKYSSRSLSE